MVPNPHPTQTKMYAVFLKHYARCGNVGQAVEEANAELGVSPDLDGETALNRRLILSWREADETFDEQCKDAESDAGDILEREAIRRARDGWDEPVFSKARNGEVEEVGVIRKFDSTMLIFLLKGFKPEKFGDRMRIQGHDGGPLQLQSARDALAEKLAQLIERRQARLTAGEAGMQIEDAPISSGNSEPVPVSEDGSEHT